MELTQGLNSRYELLSQLGRGSLGDLLRVRDRIAGTSLALRLTDFAAAPLVLDALSTVVALHNRLAQQGLPVARVCASGADAERAWYAMDALNGESLLSRVRRKGPLSPADAVRLIAPMAACLSTIHSDGIFHQDLSPGNLFICDGSLRLLELGVSPALARALAERSGALTTPRARAPEQLVADADSRTDLYAVACALYYAIIGRRAIPEGASSLRLATGGGVASPPLGGVPVELRPVLACALAMRPDERFPTARDFHATLIRTGLA